MGTRERVGVDISPSEYSVLYVPCVARCHRRDTRSCTRTVPLMELASKRVSVARPSSTHPIVCSEWERGGVGSIPTVPFVDRGEDTHERHVRQRRTGDPRVGRKPPFTNT